MEFRPERMLRGGSEVLPVRLFFLISFILLFLSHFIFFISITHEFSGHSSKHDNRSGTVCAWQVLASIFAKFDVLFADPGYTLQTKQALTIKPGCDENSAEHERGCGEPVKDASGGKEQMQTSLRGATTGVTPLYAFYGSNTGASEDLVGG